MVAHLRSSGENRGRRPSDRRWLAVFVLVLAVSILVPALRDREVHHHGKAPRPPASQSSDTAVPDTVAPAREVEPRQRSAASAKVSPTASTPPSAESSSDEPALGVLTEIGGGRLRSTAGLIYRPLRSEHRLDHVLRHGRDDPSKPVHGVFQGERDTILAIIDEAWRIAQTRGPPEVTREEQGARTALVVDLGRTIGYVGGESGQRRNHPKCRHVQLVVEGNEIVTAYPVLPR